MIFEVLYLVSTDHFHNNFEAFLDGQQYCFFSGSFG